MLIIIKYKEDFKSFMNLLVIVFDELKRKITNSKFRIPISIELKKYKERNIKRNPSV
jgi:hypothetical protein